MKKHVVKLVLLIIAMMSFVPSNTEAKWKASSISKSRAWDKASLAMDQSGQPHVIYRDAVTYTLKHTYKKGRRWFTDTVDQEDSGWYNALAIDSLGHIHASYRAELRGPDGSWESVLRYAYFDGASWMTTTVDHVGGWTTSIAVDADNRPHISYSDGDILMYARYDGYSWLIENTGFFACWFGETSIALTTSGRAYIGFLAAGSLPGPLYVANNESGSWEATQVGEGTDVGLALDSNGYPQVVYSSWWDGSGVLYSKYDGSIWTTEMILAKSDVGYGENPDIAIDPAGNIHVTFSFYTYKGERGLTKLMYAWYDGVKWNMEAADRSNAGYYTSLALNNLGVPQVTYLKYNNDKVRSSTIKYASKVVKKAPRSGK